MRAGYIPQKRGMTRRERFLQTMTFGSPDRPASGDYFGYESTLRRWQDEGLPADADLDEYFDMDFDPFRWKVPVETSIMPGFPTEVLEEDEHSTTTREATGAVVKRLKDTPPPAMPQWLSYPLCSRSDWQDYRARLDPDSAGRLPGDFDALVKSYAGRDYPLGMWVGGSFGEMRNWWGVEGISLLFYDDPSLIEEMIEHLAPFSSRPIERVLSAGVTLDWVMFWEDMAYKNAPLISPALFKKYCMRFYTQVMEKVRAAGIPVVMVDSDGDISELIPLWLDAGVPVMHPMEVASGMDVSETRRKYGKEIGFFGGIDKRALAGTREEIRAEVLPKLECCYREGGFIPACDHAIPPDVSFDNYCYYRELVRGAGS